MLGVQRGQWRPWTFRAFGGRPYTAYKSLMYFDFEDYRPDTPRIPTAISLREAVLASLVVHLLVIIAYLLLPEQWFEPAEVVPDSAMLVEPEREAPLRFVEVMPLADLEEQPIRPSDLSDIDRRSRSPERAPDAVDPLPFMRGNTPELVEGAPPTPPAPPPAPAPAPRPAPPAPREMMDASTLPEAELGYAALPPEPAPQTETNETASLTESLRNLQQYLREENFNNPRGGDTEQSADIQFDSMGVDFGPWLLRFKRQVERNWLVPAAVMSFRGRVVIRFVVRRNGYITDMTVLQPAPIPALTNAAVNALRLSNPTTQLPPEYPRDEMPIIVTFHYNDREDLRSP